MTEGGWEKGVDGSGLVVSSPQRPAITALGATWRRRGKLDAAVPVATAAALAASSGAQCAA